LLAKETAASLEDYRELTVAEMCKTERDLSAVNQHMALTFSHSLPIERK